MSFERPIGAAADVKELEYIAALIQTTDSDKEGFVDASIDARDIKYHLRSRYGIRISKEQVRKIILSGLGGGESEDDCLDLCEVVAALMIPCLRKLVTDDWIKSDSSESFNEESDGPVSVVKSNPEEESDDEQVKDRLFHELVSTEEILRDVLSNILLLATGSPKPQPLTKELVRKIFAAFDENSLVENDELVSEMIAAAGGDALSEDTEGGAVLFNTKTFARVLTSDIMLYDPSVENRYTSNFVDAFSPAPNEGGQNTSITARNSSNEIDMSEGIDAQDAKKNALGTVGDGAKVAFNTIKDDALSGLGETVIADTEYGKITKEFTFSTLDFTLDNQRSRFHVVSVWFGFIAFYLRYFYNQGNEHSVCSGDGFGCQVGQSVFNWTIVMLLLCITGVIYFAVLGSGNDVYRRSFLDVFIGVAGVLVFVVFPLIPEFQFRAAFFSTISENPSDDIFHVTAVVVFAIIATMNLYFQFTNAIRVLFSDETIGRSKFLSRMLVGSITRDERHFKQAAVFKVNRMMDNAFKLHTKDKPGGPTSTHDLALLNFNKISDKTEPAPGFFWVWKSFFNDDLWVKEGIWIHTRLLAGMLGQIFVVILIVALYSVASRFWIDDYAENVLGEQNCKASFDVENCIAPQFNGINLGFITCTEVILEGDGCSSNQIREDVLKTLCEYIPPHPVTNETVCDNARVYSFETEYASVTGENIQQGDCEAQLTACFSYEINDDVRRAACVLGIGPKFFIPYMFEGPLCESISPINSVLDSRPQLFRQAETLIRDLRDTTDDLIDKILPDIWMLRLAATVGLVTGLIVGISIFVHYVPSTVSTVLKFRSGVLPSLRDPGFIKYRKSLEGVTYILGLMIWGALNSVLLTVVVFAGATFLVVWEVTRPFLKKVIAILIGITATLTFKTILVTVLGRVNYAAFYRKRPWIGNVSGVALECWHLGLTTGYMLARTIKLIVAALLYVGRVDTPFLGEGIGNIGPVNLDAFPTIYRKGLLSAEAHRHPYIERLGYLYLLKIKHGSNFATASGSIWRLLFVFSLMPWLRKYRITDDTDLPEGLLLQALSINPETKYEQIIMQLRQENRTLKEEIRVLNEGADTKEKDEAEN